MNIRLFVFGFGYSARATVARMRPRIGKAWGTTRDPSKMVEARALGVEPLAFEGTGPSAEISETLSAADHVLVAIPPGASGDPVLAFHRHDLAARKPRALVYLSTVGVYGDHAGGWVDEASECRPVSERSLARLAAEKGWSSFADETGVPVAIVRLAGIYGPGRGPFEKIRRGTARRIVKPGQVFNRIHVDDIAAIVEAAFERRAGGLFNAADDEPAPPGEVLSYAAELLGTSPPPEVAFDSASLSPMAKSFYGENKRVRNDKIKSELGVRLRFPAYREGLAAVLAAEQAAASTGPPPASRAF